MEDGESRGEALRHEARRHEGVVEGKGRSGEGVWSDNKVLRGRGEAILTQVVLEHEFGINMVNHETDQNRPKTTGKRPSVRSLQFAVGRWRLRKRGE